MSLIYGKVLSLDAWAYIPVHMSTLTYHTTPTCNTHQIHTHTKYIHIHRHRSSYNENENKLNV